MKPGQVALCSVSRGTYFRVGSPWAVAGGHLPGPQALSVQQPLLSNLGLELTSYYTGFRTDKERVDTVSSDKAQPLLSAYCMPDHEDAKEAGEPPELQGERGGGACLSRFGHQRQMLT